MSCNVMSIEETEERKNFVGEVEHGQTQSTSLADSIDGTAEDLMTDMKLDEEHGGTQSTSLADSIDETAEDLMTDMKLDDNLDDLRATQPDFYWTYHIEIYPWSAEDMTENFVRLLKLAEFSQIFMTKKGVCKDNREPESLDDRLPARERKGSIHFYTDNSQNAKNIIRSSTWKTMVSKLLTFEITRRKQDSTATQSAYLELDTYAACKCRYRDKVKGERLDRSAKVSGLSGNISLEFLDVVFCRAYAIIGGSTVQEYHKERDGKLQQNISQLNSFNGSLDFDCLSKGSCRAFVTAHRNVYIDGRKVSIVANNEETMATPIEPSNTLERIATPDKSEDETSVANQSNGSKVYSQSLSRLRGNLTHQQPARATAGHVHTQSVKECAPTLSLGKGRGSQGRVVLMPQKTVCSTFTRSGPGMPVPMTGRQKMNEKMRRSSMSQTTGPPASSSQANSQSGPSGVRNTTAVSLGESFKQEIASLQNQLHKNTAELQAKIALLQQKSTATGANLQDIQGESEEIYYTDYGGDEYYEDRGLRHQNEIGFENLQDGIISSPSSLTGGIYPGIHGGLGPQAVLQPRLNQFGLTTQGFTGQMPQASQAQMFQVVGGHQNVLAQTPPNVLAQTPQDLLAQLTLAGQMVQTLQGQLLQQSLQGQMNQQLLSGQDYQLPLQGQINPQAFQSHQHIQQPMHGNVQQGITSQMGQLFHNTVPHVRPGMPTSSASTLGRGFRQVRPQRGSCTFQVDRGSSRGRPRGTGP